jgi:hypothetical protein
MRRLLGVALLTIGALLAATPVWSVFRESPDLNTTGKVVVIGMYTGAGLLCLWCGALLVRRR